MLSSVAGGGTSKQAKFQSGVSAVIGWRHKVSAQAATLLQVHSLDGGAEPDGGIVQDGSSVVMMIARDQSDVCAVMVAENSHDRQLQCGARN